MTNLRTGRVLVPLALLVIVLVTAVGAGLAAASPPPLRPAGSMPTPIADGGGELVPEAADDDIGPAERLRIQRTLDATIARLEQAGTLPRAGEQVELLFPLRRAAGFDDPGYYYITGFVDHNPAYPAARLDYACGSRTYDTAGGYNHKGTDYYLWPFTWNLANAGVVEIVAAAPGTIIGHEDGNPDRSCSMSGGRWNAVYIRHDDGSIAWYGHMKLGSLTTKDVGMRVEAGEYLGLVGSSGNSTGPHLHLELYRSQWVLADPYVGECNPTTDRSWWVAQEPYRDPTVMKLMTGTANVMLSTCPNEDITYAADYFRPGDTIYFTSVFRDRHDDMGNVHRIYRPDGSLWTEWAYTDMLFMALSTRWRAYRTEENAPLGEWRYEVTFNGETYSHRFYLTDNPDPMLTASPTPTPTASPTPTATPTPTPTTTATPDPRFIFPVYLPLVGQ